LCIKSWNDQESLSISHVKNMFRKNNSGMVVFHNQSIKKISQLCVKLSDKEMVREVIVHNKKQNKKGIISCILYLIMIITKLHELTDIYL
jgi:hypothetical protein